MADGAGENDLTQAGTDALYTALYQELKRVARRQRKGNGLQTTALVNEAYFKLMDAEGQAAAWADRTHFLKTASLAMRQVMVDEARAQLTDKRGGKHVHQSIDATGFAETVAGNENQPEFLLALDQAMDTLQQINPRLEQVVQHRYFGGYSMEEIADLVDANERTVRRDWTKAKTILQAMLAEQA